MRHQILLVVIIEFDTCLLTESFENVPSSVGRDGRWCDVDLDTGLDERLVLFDLLDLCLGVATVNKRLGNPLGKGRPVEGGKDWSI